MNKALLENFHNRTGRVFLRRRVSWWLASKENPPTLCVSLDPLESESTGVQLLIPLGTLVKEIKRYEASKKKGAA